MRLSPFSTRQDPPYGNARSRIHIYTSHSRPSRPRPRILISHTTKEKGRNQGAPDIMDDLDELLDVWGSVKPVLLAGNFKPELAQEVMAKYSRLSGDMKEKERANLAIVFGRHFISNPDLVFRVFNNVELEPHDRSTFYGPVSEKGYTTYKNSASREATK